MSLLRTTLACTALVVALFATPARSDLQHPSDRVIFEVSGSVSNKNTDSGASFDRAMLSTLPQKKVSTSTAWTDGVQEFSGPLARDVLSLAGASGTSVRAVALNDYAVTIPMSDFETFDVIIAMEMNGKKLSVRDKGPLWIVYPRDAHPELQSAAHNEKWIWQLRRFDVQ